MRPEKAHFDRIGIAYVPCTVVGWMYLFSFVIATLSLMFAARSIWAFAGWQGADAVQVAILVAGALATVRFAHERSRHVDR